MVGQVFPGGADAPTTNDASNDDQITVLRAIAVSVASLAAAFDLSTGNVTGPTSAVDSNLTAFDGITGKVIKDSGISMASAAASIALTAGLIPTALIADAIVAAVDADSIKVYTGSETIANLDSVVRTCILACDNGVTNIPVAGNYTVFSMRRATNFMTQIAQNRDSNVIWIRQQNSGVWSAWLRLVGTTDVATVAEVRAATAATATSSKFINSPLIETASDFVALVDAATITFDWDAGINYSIDLAGDRLLGNPSNNQIGTWRTIWIRGNNATPRTLTFSSNLIGATAAITGITSTNRYIISMLALNSTFAYVFPKSAAF